MQRVDQAAGENKQEVKMKKGLRWIIGDRGGARKRNNIVIAG